MPFHGAAAIIAYTTETMLRICLICLLLLCPGLAAAAPGDSAQARRAQAELEALRAKIEQVRDSIDKGRERHDELATKLEQTGRTVRETAAELDALEKSIGKLKQHVTQLKRQRDAEQAQLGGELDLLRAQVRAAYRNGRTNKLRLLLSGENPAHIGRMLMYYEYFAQRQAQQIAALRSKLTHLAQRQAKLEIEQHKLDRQRASRAATLDHLRQSRAEREAALAALEERLQRSESTLHDYQLAEGELEALIDELGKKLQRKRREDSGAFAKLKGQMQPPVEGPVLAAFGAAKAKGKMRWKGQWRAAPEDTPIRAVAGGQVVYIGYLHHYGLIIVLQHTDGYFSVYGHIKSSYVEIGDPVSQGQKIALAGTSGGHRRSGVYFELRHGKQALDPARWFGN